MKSPSIKLIFFATICLLSLCGCESMVNDIDQSKLPKTESKLVVECYISPQSKRIEVLVTESQPLFGVATYDIKAVKNAKVTLSGPSGEITIPFIDSLSTYVLPASEFKIEAGKAYRLVVSDPTRTVKATCTVPLQSLTLKKYTLSQVEGPPDRWDTTSHTIVAKVRFYWDDILGEKNFYGLRGYANITQNYYGFNPATGTTGMNRYEQKNTFDIRNIADSNMDGLTLNSDLMEFRLYNHTNQYKDNDGKIVQYKSETAIKEIYLEILNVDENYYKFQQTVGHDSDDNPFIEPTLVYTNVENGLGCFGAFNASGSTIKP